MQQKYAIDTGPWFHFWLGGVSGAAALFMIFALSSSLSTTCNFVYGLNEWQTLVGSVLALAAAIFTIFVLREQIGHEQRIAADALERKQFAAKTALPVALAGLSEYCDACVAALRSFVPHIDNDGRLSVPTNFNTPTIPTLPTQSARLLEQAVESASHANRVAIAWVLIRLQIIDSRLRGIQPMIAPDSGFVFVRQNLISYLLDVIEFKVRAEHLFPYSRGETDIIATNCSAGNVATVAFSFALEDYYVPGFQEAALRRFATEIDTVG